MPPNPTGERYGYTVSRNFNVKVRDIGNAGRGQRRVHELRSDGDQRRELRALPTRARRARAGHGERPSRTRGPTPRRIARAAALRIVGIKSIELTGERRARCRSCAAAVARAPTQFDQSNVNVTVSVSVVFVAKPYGARRNPARRARVDQAMTFDVRRLRRAPAVTSYGGRRLCSLRAEAGGAERPAFSRRRVGRSRPDRRQRPARRKDAGWRSRASPLDELGKRFRGGRRRWRLFTRSDRARARTASSIRSSGATRNRARGFDPRAAQQKQSRARRRTGRRQDGDRRRSRAAHRRRQRAGLAARQTRSRTLARAAGRRHEVSRRIRRPRQAHPRRSQAQRARRRALHRRAAHARRSRRRRGRAARSELDDQARAGARRTAMHRRDDVRRIPQVRRIGCGARAPLPAGHGRRAEHRARRSRSYAVCASATRATTTSPSAKMRSRPPRTSRRASSPIASCPTRPSISSTKPRRPSRWRTKATVEQPRGRPRRRRGRRYALDGHSAGRAHRIAGQPASRARAASVQARHRSRPRHRRRVRRDPARARPACTIRANR